MERPFILHLFTPTPQASPFDVNMAADAGYQLIMPYTGVSLDAISGLTQDAIFSRGPKGVARTGIFIGGRDVALAADMAQRAVAAMVPPFVVSVMADPSGAFTTAAGLVGCVEAALKKHHGTTLAGKRVLLLGGTGTVGRVAAVLCAQSGATALISSRHGLGAAQACADDTGKRFGATLHGVAAGDSAGLRTTLADVDVVLGVAAAGVQVLKSEDRGFAPKLLVAADVNAVPPAGIAGVGVMDNGAPIAGTQAVGIGALAVGNVKYQVQHRLLLRMREGGKALNLGFEDAFAMAREVLAEAKA